MTNQSDISTSTPNNSLADLDGAVNAPSTWLTNALSIPREENYINVDGCDIHYFRWGDKSKPGILMMHGFLAHARCFAFIAPYLANNYHIVAYDHSGMGDSGTRDSYPNESRISEAMGVATQTGLFDHAQKPIIVAHSFGGLVATNTIHQHPNSFAGFVICDLMILRPSQIKKMSPLTPNNITKQHKIYPDYKTAKARFRLAPEQKIEHQELFDYMAYNSLKQIETGWSWKFSTSLFNQKENTPQGWAQIAKSVVTLPIRKTIIHGEQSALFNSDSITYIQELLKEENKADFPIIGIPQARHHLMLDQPIAFISVLRMVLEIWRNETASMTSSS